MLSHTTWLVARWQMALSEYDIIYVNQKVVKRSVLVEHLAYHPLEESQPLFHEFPNEHIMVATSTKPHLEEWTMWFNGASNLLRNGIGVVLASPKDRSFPFSARLGFDCINNMEEYEACTMGLTMALKHQHWSSTSSAGNGRHETSS
ncbi:hypothetical protein CR513_03246, partial [Mucuna pruriens]